MKRFILFIMICVALCASSCQTNNTTDRCYISEIGTLCYEANYGDDLATAQDALSSQINAYTEMRKLDWNSENWDTTRVYVSYPLVYVKDAPDAKVTFYSINVYMYHLLVEEYYCIGIFGALDSHGNFYSLTTFPD